MITINIRLFDKLKYIMKNRVKLIINQNLRIFIIFLLINFVKKKFFKCFFVIFILLID